MRFLPCPADEHILEKARRFHNVQTAFFQFAVFDVNNQMPVTFHARDVIDFNSHLLHVTLLRCGFWQ